MCLAAPEEACNAERRSSDSLVVNIFHSDYHIRTGFIILGKSICASWIRTVVLIYLFSIRFASWPFSLKKGVDAFKMGYNRVIVFAARRSNSL